MANPVLSFIRPTASDSELAQAIGEKIASCLNDVIADLLNQNNALRARMFANPSQADAPVPTRKISNS